MRISNITGLVTSSNLLFIPATLLDPSMHIEGNQKYFSSGAGDIMESVQITLKSVEVNLIELMALKCFASDIEVKNLNRTSNVLLDDVDALKSHPDIKDVISDISNEYYNIVSIDEKLYRGLPIAMTKYFVNVKFTSQKLLNLFGYSIYKQLEDLYKSKNKSSEDISNFIKQTFVKNFKQYIKSFIENTDKLTESAMQKSFYSFTESSRIYNSNDFFALAMVTTDSDYFIDFNRFNKEELKESVENIKRFNNSEDGKDSVTYFLISMRTSIIDFMIFYIYTNYVINYLSVEQIEKDLSESISYNSNKEYFKNNSNNIMVKSLRICAEAVNVLLKNNYNTLEVSNLIPGNALTKYVLKIAVPSRFLINEFSKISDDFNVNIEHVLKDRLKHQLFNDKIIDSINKNKIDAMVNTIYSVMNILTQ